MDMSKWEPKRMWSRRGLDFMVQVYHHTQPVVDGSGCWDSEGENRWAVYAFIYPKHPHFGNFSGPKMYQDAASSMPLHCGPSLLEYPMYDSKVTAVKVGADYHHLYDTHFSRYATPAEASEVFRDAEQLFDWLAERASGRVPPSPSTSAESSE